MRKTPKRISKSLKFSFDLLCWSFFIFQHR